MNNPLQPERPQGVNYFQPHLDPDDDREGRRPGSESSVRQSEAAGPGRRVKPWILAVGGGAVIAIVAVAVVVLTGGDDPGDTPQSTADAFVQAMRNHDLGTVNDLSCAGSKLTAKDFTAQTNPVTDIRVKSVGAANNGESILLVTATINNQETDKRYPMREHNGTWCVGREGAITAS